jgi:DNA-binding MarR family transcriptional regulator
MASQGAKTDDLVEIARQLQQRMEELEEVVRPIIPQVWLNMDLTMPQLKIMVMLWREGPTRMTELASGLAVTLATATGIVDRLVEKNHVVRESLPGDRRVVLCRLSDEGQEFMETMWLSGRTQVARILKMMTPEQLKAVAQGVEVFIEAARTLQSASDGEASTD